ncbi:MAG TPA: hypothetical protein VFN09_09175 [Rhodanobacteraceae bacterium]|nr:hypothetical protein [Rhodanobacteraceae bacterium]
MVSVDRVGGADDRVALVGRNVVMTGKLTAAVARTVVSRMSWEPALRQNLSRWLQSTLIMVDAIGLVATLRDILSQALMLRAMLTNGSISISA